MPFGPLEIGIVLLIVLVIFGPKRLPDLGRSLGGGMREFKDSVTGNHKDSDDELPAGEKKSEPVQTTEKSDATPAGGKSS
jgi:sec-independent protein translocase protein TatA